MIYKLQKGKIITKAISLAEKLGIPKAMRSNPKALEDPYYWGYQQWNSRYNAAIKSGNLKEAQRLRALHFITKAPNTKIIEATGMPKEVYHGGQQKFTIFDSSKTRPDYDYGTSTNMFSDNKNVALGYANNDPDKLHSVYLNLQNILERDFEGNPWNGSVNHTSKFQIVPEYGTTYSSKQEAETALQKILDQYYPNNPAKQAEQRHYMYVIELMDPPHPERSTNAFSDEITNTPTLDGGIVKNVKDYYDLPKFDENPELYKELTSPHTDYFVKDPRNIKSSAIITYDNSGRIVPIVKRDNFHNPDVRHEQGGIIKAQRGLGKIITKALKPVVKNSKKGLNLESWPKASYKYNFETGDFDVVVPLKDWVKEGEYLTYDYFDSPFEYNRLLESGASPDLANEIMAVRSGNTINRLPNAFRNLGKNIYGTAENKDGRPLIRYNARRGVKSSLVTPEITLNTVFHELGGHGSSLNIGSGVQVIPEGQIEILPKIYKHNAELKPVLRPIFQAIKDGDLETANSLASSLDDMYKDESGKLNIKKIKELIEYMEDVQEYSARAIASNMSDYYGLKPGWNEEQLRKYFTDESVDNLKKMVWGIGVPLTASIISSNELKKGGIIKAQGGWGKVVRKMPNLLLEAIGTGKKAASEFFEHPVVKQSYEHNKDIAKRLGITLQDRPENIAEIVNRPIGVGYEAYKNNGEFGAIHHSGIDDPNDRFSVSWIPMTELDAKRIGFHESLHRGFYSAPIKYVNTDFDYYKNVYQPTYKYWHWKTSKLLKPGTMDSYLGDVHSGEAGTNLAEVGKIAGVKIGEKWPGDEKFWETLDKWPEDKKFMLEYLNTDTRAGRRHIWDAMAGKYFTVGTAAAFSNWLNNSKDKETKKPAL